MGGYLNPGSDLFEMALRSQIFVDKSGLIEKTNRCVRTLQRYICVSRPRRFGKSMGVDMLAAYYDRSVDTKNLFQELKINSTEEYEKHLNQYDVLKINMQEFLSATENIDQMLRMLNDYLLFDLKEQYGQVRFRDENSLVQVMKDVYSYTKHPFVILIDEWDCLFREYQQDQEAQKKYEMSFEEASAWYNGYHLISHEEGVRRVHSMYSPKSVVEAMQKRKFGTYWNQTETYEALKVYIQMNMDGLKDTIIEMLAGEKARINTGTFSNDMTTFATKDDVLTLLVHLGYLTYDNEKETVEIPNREVSQEYVNAISTMDWTEVIQSINASRKLLEALWDMDSEKVANGIEQAHKEISILEYNDENSLSCAVNLAFYFAREYYTIIREMPGGRGFADICMIPRKIHLDKPAVMIELKWDKSAEGAIQQIKNKEYIDALKDYQGDLLLAGINYDKKTKKHSCIIEKWNL